MENHMWKVDIGSFRNSSMDPIPLRNAMGPIASRGISPREAIAPIAFRRQGGGIHTTHCEIR